MAKELITKAEADKIRKKHAPTVAKAEKMIIKTTTQENSAYEELKVIKEALKFVEEKRTAITGPLNQSLKATNSMFKELFGPLKNADKLIRGKILEFRRQQQLAAAKEEEKRNKIRESHKKRGHKVHAPAVIEPEVGKSTTQKRWVFEVVDITKVPSEFLVVDSAEVNNSIADGVREIAGLKIFQKETLSVR